MLTTIVVFNMKGLKNALDAKKIKNIGIERQNYYYVVRSYIRNRNH